MEQTKYNRPPVAFEVLKQRHIANRSISIPYDELLWTEEWIAFRNKIKRRDNFTCTCCGVSQVVELTHEEFERACVESGYGKYLDILTGTYVDEPTTMTLKKNETLPPRIKMDRTIKLEVHHEYYIWNALPWEYDLAVLATLCERCHELAHQKKRVVYTNELKNKVKELTDCYRCGGKGRIPEYNHVENGVCFTCGGLGGLEPYSKLNSLKFR